MNWIPLKSQTVNPNTLLQLWLSNETNHNKLISEQQIHLSEDRPCFGGGGGGGRERKKGALHKEKSRNINLWKTSECVKNKSNFENRIAIHFAFVE
jgi:hypothetical protein